MNESDVKKYWEENADGWAILSGEGYDVYRNYLNTPAFLKIFPCVKGLKGLDIGCGEGYNTRKIAERGAIITGIDLSEKFINYAKKKEQENTLNIKYLMASGLNLPFENETFNFCIATMSLMDMPEHEKAISEAYRVLKKGGFFQFSISHPCFFTPEWQWITNEEGKRLALMCGDYFKELNGEIEEWIFGAAPGELKNKFNKFKNPRFTRTLSSWLNLLVQ